MANQKDSKKTKRAKRPMAVTKAGRKSNPMPQPKAVIVHSMPIDKPKDVEYMEIVVHDEKHVPDDVQNELWSMFMKLDKKGKK